MAAARKMEECLVTTFGTDGACAAALLLRACPAARIVITSASRAPQTMLDLAAEGKRNRRIHLCGVGIGEEPEAVFSALAELSKRGAAVIWYCGRGYLDEFAERLGALCETVLPRCASNTEAVFRSLQPGRDKHAVLLLEIAAEFAAKTPDLPPDHAWLHDFIEASAARYFKYDDESAFELCIRKLAGILEFTAADRKEVGNWRAGGGKALPLGRSPAMKKVRSMITRLAPVEEPVLVLGPSGAGKEMIARLLHDASPRAEGPFVPVNCAVLSSSSDLALDRLFGHRAGAYTGAVRDGKGAFEVADGGTLFLDEAGELPLEAQTQLLRVLEEGTVTPLGTMEARRVNVRIVAATNRDLLQMVEEGTFRLDLYHRLNVLTLEIPELRQRREDLPAIANAAIHRLKEKGYPLKLSQADWEAVYAYDWPGNIRQFLNMLKRAAYLKIPVAEALGEEVRRSQRVSNAPGTAKAGKKVAGGVVFWPQSGEEIVPLEEVRRIYMNRALELCEGNWTQAARMLGVAVNTLRNTLLSEE